MIIFMKKTLLQKSGGPWPPGLLALPAMKYSGTLSKFIKYCYISLLAQADLIPKNSQKNGPLPMAKGLLYSSLLMSLKLFLKFLLFPTKLSSVIIQS